MTLERMPKRLMMCAASEGVGLNSEQLVMRMPIWRGLMPGGAGGRGAGGGARALAASGRVLLPAHSSAPHPYPHPHPHIAPIHTPHPHHTTPRHPPVLRSSSSTAPYATVSNSPRAVSMDSCGGIDDRPAARAGCQQRGAPGHVQRQPLAGRWLPPAGSVGAAARRPRRPLQAAAAPLAAGRRLLTWWQEGGWAQARALQHLALEEADLLREPLRRCEGGRWGGRWGGGLRGAGGQGVQGQGGR
jgi:hypothetical protein